MPQPTPEQIADIVLNRRLVYDLDTDSRIRQAANGLTARALFELLARADDQLPNFAEQLAALFDETPPISLRGLIGFDTGDFPASDEEEIPDKPQDPCEHYLRLVFSDKDAAIYQFPIFPNLDVDYVLGASRKLAGEAQYLRITLSHPEALQTFTEDCRSNPFFLRIEQSTADEFWSARSNAS